MYRRYMEPDIKFHPMSENEPQHRKKHGNTGHHHSNGGLFPGNLDSILSFLPEGTDLGDVILLLVLLLLYIDSKDEEFLIMLIVTACSVFKIKLI